MSNDPKKILLVFGTRPEAIKMAPLVAQLKSEKIFDTRVCLTGQHREMLDQVTLLFGINADYDLDLMRAGQDLTDITCGVLKGLREILSNWRPDLILVHGDTSTSFAASLAAFYQQIPIGHVEAGLRTGNISSPWPEEGNRKLTAHLANLHFAPTEEAKKNLLTEGISEEKITVTGNTVIDALLSVRRKIYADSGLQNSLIEEYPFLDDKRRLILVTNHRRESFGAPIERVCNALKQISELFPDVQIVYPVHKNPNILNVVNNYLSGIENIFLIEPQGYLSFVYLMTRSYLILTDSGGIQEEAPSLGKPVLVTRDVTERLEAVAAGTVKMVGTNTEVIVSTISELLANQKSYELMSLAHNPYGDGLASTRILAELKAYFEK